MNDQDPRQLRKSREDVVQYLDKLDAVSSDNPEQEGRTAKRYIYRIRAMRVVLTGPDGNPVTYVLPTRNLSATGVSVLIGHFVYPDSKCAVQLISMQKNTQPVPGHIARCRYIAGSGSLHEIGIEFDTPIEIEKFHRGAQTTRLLVIDSDPMTGELVRQFLNSYDLILSTVDTLDAAVRCLDERHFDLVMIGIDMPTLDGTEILEKIRARGYLGPAIAITAHAQSQIRQQCFVAGFDRLLEKPLSRESLIQALDSTATEPLSSTFSNDPDMAVLVEKFLADLPIRVRCIQTALQKQNTEDAEQLVRMLKGQAGAYGFDVITQVASWVETSLIKKADVDQISKQVIELARWCHSAQSGRKNT